MSCRYINDYYRISKENAKKNITQLFKRKERERDGEITVVDIMRRTDEVVEEEKGAFKNWST